MIRTAIIETFKDLVYSQGLSKTAALDIVVDKFKDENNVSEVYTRTVIRGADGWYY